MEIAREERTDKKLLCQQKRKGAQHKKCIKAEGVRKKQGYAGFRTKSGGMWNT